MTLSRWVLPIVVAKQRLVPTYSIEGATRGDAEEINRAEAAFSHVTSHSRR